MNNKNGELTSNHLKYLEGKDYIVDIEYKGSNTFFYFRTPKGDLIGYSKLYEPEDNELCRGTIVDAISAYKLSTNLSPKMQELFKQNGYTGAELKDFGSNIYSYILIYLQERYGDKILINVASNDNDAARDRIMTCISKTQERTSGIIQKVRGGDDGDAAVIYLLNQEKR